ncbi:MAG TPA: hypothetical protein VG709_04805, partial [Actinomycetota bacterium]|nr:hypothetical protein [Actinomycetota bacterium]
LPLESGWAHPDPAMLEFLQSSGLPTPERQGDARVGAAWNPRPAFVGIVVLGALFLGAAAIDRRRRVAPTP